MKIFLYRGLFSLSLLAAFCSCGSSNVQSPTASTNAPSSSFEVVNQFSLPGPGDQVVSEAAITPNGHLAYTILKKDFEGDILNYEGLVFLDRPGEGSRTLTVHRALQARPDEIIEFLEPQLDGSGQFASWRESIAGETRIGYLGQDGRISHWTPPAGSQFRKNLGVETEGGLRLYAILETQGTQELVRFDPSKGEVAGYILPGIAVGSLNLVMDGTCRYATGVASDGTTTQLIYLVNQERPSVQVLTTEAVQTFTVNSIGDVGYTNQNGDLSYLRPEATLNQMPSVPDSLTKVNVKVLGDAPPLAMGNLYQAAAQQLANAAHNATGNQEQSNITAQSSTNQGVSTLYGFDTVNFSSSLLFVTPASAISNESSLIPPSFTLESMDVEGENAALVIGRELGGRREVRILRGAVLPSGE